MDGYFKKNTALKMTWSVITIFWIILSLLALSYYKGDTGFFLFFCMAFFAMWAIGWVNVKSYFYIFFSSFLVLGFWIKCILNITFNSRLIEPIGKFTGTPAAWDKVIIVSTVAAISVFSARVLFLVIFNKQLVRFQQNIESIFKKSVVPNWYKKYRNLTWFVSVLFVCCIVGVNFKYSINQIGVVPLINFPFKINVIISWLLNGGIALWVATIIWWEILSNDKFSWRIYLVPFVGCLVSGSMLSRGYYLYQVGHYFLSFSFTKIWQRVSLKSLAIFTALFALCFFLNFQFVMGERNVIYPNELKWLLNKEKIDKEKFNSKPLLLNTMILPAPTTNNASFEKPVGNFIQNISSSVGMMLLSSVIPSAHADSLQLANSTKSSSGFVQHIMNTSISSLFLRLSAGRWIGLEGLMAVSSWPNLGQTLFHQAWTEKPTVTYSNESLYATVCNAIYIHSDYFYNRSDYTGTRHYHFASLPGVVAILYYSGSYWVVFIGMFFVVFLILMSEMLIQRLLKNPFIMSYYGIYLAITISMLNNIYLTVIQILQMVLTLIFIWFLQKRVSHSSNKEQGAVGEKKESFNFA